MTTLNLGYTLTWQDKNFIKSLPNSLRHISKSEHQKIKEDFIKIFNAESPNLQDRQSQSFLLMCSYIAAYYEHLRSYMAKDIVVDQLTNALLRSAGGKYVTFFTKVMLWVTRDKRKFIEKSTIQSKKSFGSFLNLEEEKKEHQFVSIVTKCGIYEFFTKRQTPELTLVFCKWDQLWANEINKRPRGISFKRSSTIATNSSTCRFEFDFDKK